MDWSVSRRYLHKVRSGSLQCGLEHFQEILLEMRSINPQRGLERFQEIASQVKVWKPSTWTGKFMEVIFTLRLGISGGIVRLEPGRVTSGPFPTHDSWKSYDHRASWKKELNVLRPQVLSLHTIPESPTARGRRGEGWIKRPGNTRERVR